MSWFTSNRYVSLSSILWGPQQFLEMLKGFWDQKVWEPWWQHSKFSRSLLLKDILESFVTVCLAIQSSFIFFLLGLFSALDSHSNLGVISYGVSMTTLEDVFLKLEVEAEIDQAGKNKSNRTF